MQIFDTAFNPNVYFSTIKNVYDNKIRNHFKIAWFELVDFLYEQKHLVTDNKNVACISPWKYRYERLDSEDVAPIEDVSDFVEEKAYAIDRVAANVVGTSMLMLDFDGKVSLDSMMWRMSEFTCFGYTSFSHMSPSKDGKDCFRVMIPLANFVAAEQLVQRRKAIYADFPGVDESCLSLSRSFYIPSCPPERKHLSRIWRNHAEFLDVLDYEPETYVAKEFNEDPRSESENQRIIQALKSIYLGHEPEWYKVALATRSSYARLGLSTACNCDLINPGYDGHVPLELTNVSKNILLIRPYLPLCQIFLMPIQGATTSSYADQQYNSKYIDDDGGPSRWWRDELVKKISTGVLKTQLNDTALEELRKKFEDIGDDGLYRLEKLTESKAFPNSAELMSAFTSREKTRSIWYNIWRVVTAIGGSTLVWPAIEPLVKIFRGEAYQFGRVDVVIWLFFILFVLMGVQQLIYAKKFYSEID